MENLTDLIKNNPKYFIKENHKYGPAELLKGQYGLLVTSLIKLMQNNPSESEEIGERTKLSYRDSVEQAQKDGVNFFYSKTEKYFIEGDDEERTRTKVDYVSDAIAKRAFKTAKEKFIASFSYGSTNEVYTYENLFGYGPPKDDSRGYGIDECMDVLHEHNPKTTRSRQQLHEMVSYFESSAERREKRDKTVKSKMEGYLHEIWACVVFRPFEAPEYGSKRSTEFDAAAKLLGLLP